MRYVSVTFTGNSVPYNYNFSEGNPVIGDRVIVPTKMKPDNSVTLTIATVVALSDTPLPNADKPVITFLCAATIAGATAVCARLEAERVQAIT